MTTAEKLREEGLEQGLEQGIKEGKLEDARRMKEEGLPNDMISRVTGLSVEEIEGL